MAEQHESFLSEDTERKIAEFTKKLELEQAAMPDTSIRSGTGGIDAPENYYFNDNESIPIYNSTLNKRIDRVDMEVDKAKRMRRTRLADEMDHYAKQIHAQNAAQDSGSAGSGEEPQQHKTAAFIYIVPAALVVFGIVVVAAMSLA